MILSPIPQGGYLPTPLSIAGGPAHKECVARPGIDALKVVDLFSGAGGISEGFRQAGYEVIGASEIDPDAAATFSANFSKASVVVGNIRECAVRDRIIDLARTADVIVGGPPCQAFSQVRNHARMLEDPRNSLYREFVRVVGDCLPYAFLMENVTGIDQMGVREQILVDLALDGEYKVYAQVVNAADFGVPQTRKRLLFFGAHKSLGCDPPRLRGANASAGLRLDRSPGLVGYRVVPNGFAEEVYFAPRLADPDDLSLVTAEQAIADLCALPIGGRRDEIAYEHLAAPTSEYQREMRIGSGALLSNVQVPRINEDTRLRLAGIPPGGNYRDLTDDLQERYLTGQRWGQSNGSGRLSRRHFYAYRRLHPDIWAWTLNTKADAVYHYQVARALSVREFARLQSFPDRFRFCTDSRRGTIPNRVDGGPAHSRYRQVGNAVPPLLARAAARVLAPIVQGAVEPTRQSA